MRSLLLRAGTGITLAWVLSACGASMKMAPEAPDAYAPARAAVADAAPGMAGGAQGAQPMNAPAPVANVGGGAPPGLATGATGAKVTTTTTKPRTAEAQSPDVLIVYTGDVQMMVDEERMATTIDKIIDAAEAVGGHLAGRKDTSVQVKVPSAHFRDALSHIEELGAVTHRSVSAEDVSEEYHDAEVQLANLKATRQRLQDFLSKAPNVKDMLTVEHELERIGMDIDRIEGRMRYLRVHTAFSLISVELTAKPKPVKVIAQKPPPPPKAPPPRAMDLPVTWLDDMGVPQLLQVEK